MQMHSKSLPLGLAILRFSEVDRRNPFPLRVFHEAQPGFSLAMNEMRIFLIWLVRLALSLDISPLMI